MNGKFNPGANGLILTKIVPQRVAVSAFAAVFSEIGLLRSGQIRQTF
jgi:hypothetical protein